MNRSVVDSLRGIKNVLIFFGTIALAIALILAQKDIIHILLLYSTGVLFAILLDELTTSLTSVTPISRPVALEQLFSKSLGGFSEFIFVFLIASFLTLSPRLYIDNLILLFHASKREQIRKFTDAINISIRKWFLGRFCAMALIGVLTFICLSIIGLQSSLVLGLIAGVLTIIPFLGAIISVIPSLLVALSTNPILAIWVILIFLGTHFEEDIFAPIIQQKNHFGSPGVTSLHADFSYVHWWILGIVTCRTFMPYDNSYSSDYLCERYFR